MKNRYLKEFEDRISPEDSQYLADVKSNMNNNDNSDDVVYVAKLLGFYTKFKNLHWGAKNNSIHVHLDEFSSELNDYIDAISENIQSIIGQFDNSEINEVTIPTGNDPIQVINDLKDEVENWFEVHKDDMEYEGCRNETSGFLEIIHKYIYLFYLCKEG